MAEVNAQLAALIGSRICHDLISPIGAINNGLELLTMSGSPSGPEIGLIGESVDNASARIRFFRIAFGASGEQMVGQAEVVSILRDFYGAGRLSVTWQQTNAVSRREVRLCFLAILCCEMAMPYGGEITLSRNATKWSVQGQADRIILDEELWGRLSGGAAQTPLQPSQVQFALLPLLAVEEGRKIFATSDDSSLKLKF